MEKGKAKKVFVLSAIAALAVAEAAQAWYSHRLAERIGNHEGAPIITRSAQPVATAHVAWNHPFAYLRQVRRALDQQERDMAQAFSLWPAPPVMAGLPSASSAGAAETVRLQARPGEYVVSAKLPAGVGAKQAKVELVGRQLSLYTHLSRRIKGPDGRGAQTYSSAYVESFILPGPVVDAAMREQFRGGVLTVTIPKARGRKVTL